MVVLTTTANSSTSPPSLSPQNRSPLQMQQDQPSRNPESQPLTPDRAYAKSMLLMLKQHQAAKQSSTNEEDEGHNPSRSPEVAQAVARLWPDSKEPNATSSSTSQQQTDPEADSNGDSPEPPKPDVSE